MRGTRIVPDSSVQAGGSAGADASARPDPALTRHPRRRVSIGTMLFAAVLAALVATVVTASVYTARNREAALQQEIDALSVKLAAAAQALEDCEASRQSVTDAVAELSAARNDMDSALAAFDQGVAMDVTESAIVAANARYAGALDVLAAIPGCATG
jgi:septal ring factor EnvC (AmiA/AmiB activator)